MAVVQLHIDDFRFVDTEIPEKIAFGGRQAMSIKNLIGGARVIDANGPIEDPLSWSGLFRGEEALGRARFIDTLRRAGKPHKLTFSGLSYTVVISEFRADFERWFQIPYSITCEPVANNNSPIKVAPPPSIDQSVSADMATASGLVTGLNIPGLSSVFATLSSAIGAVSTFANAAKSAIGSVLGPLATVQGTVNSLIASTSNSLSFATTLGGVLPNNPISQNVQRLTQTISGFNQMGSLVDLNSVLGRIGGNIATAAPNVASITSAGGNMMAMASAAYGDAMSWTTIARANGLLDPVLAGINTIKIPPIADLAGGILRA